MQIQTRHLKGGIAVLCAALVILTGCDQPPTGGAANPPAPAPVTTTPVLGPSPTTYTGEMVDDFTFQIPFAPSASPSPAGGEQINDQSAANRFTPHVAVVPLTQIISDNSGATVALTFQIYNMGYDTDTYSVSITSTQGWQIDRSELPVTLTIAARSGVTYTISSTIPRNANPTDENMIEVTAQSQNHSESYDVGAAKIIVKCPVSFTDVHPDAIGTEAYAIYYVACRNIITGLAQPDGSYKFAPQASISRADFARALMVGLSLKPYTPTIPSFADVPASSPTYRYIETIVHIGFLNGDASGKFNPNASIKRGDAAVAIAAVPSLQLLSYNPGQVFQDVPESSPYMTATATLDANAYFRREKCGQGSGFCFRPDDALTRGELSVVLRNILDH